MYFDYYGEAMKAGRLTEREKSLIALVVATTQKCPYCIDAYTNQCLSLSISKEEMMEAPSRGGSCGSGNRPGPRYPDAKDHLQEGNVRCLSSSPLTHRSHTEYRPL